MNKVLRIIFRSRWSFFCGLLASLLLMAGGVGLYRSLRDTEPQFELTDQLGGNIFPSAILSTATTDTMIVPPVGPNYVGNGKSPFAVRIHTERPNTSVRVQLAATPFYGESVSEFILPKGDTDYTIYPEVLWNYDRLRRTTQPEPVNVVVSVSCNGRESGTRTRTFSMRSMSECLLGYYQKKDGRLAYRNTSIFFAAYVNEDNPQIDGILREALNTRIVRRFVGYQSKTAASVDKQVYALWYVLQQHNFRYSSISNSSLSSNVVMSQRVRTFSDALRSSQINCVDGSALFASLLRAINITPILVRIPGHMFIGYYSDAAATGLTFLETTMIGDVDLDDYFPEEKLDSTIVGMTRKQASRMTFDKAKEYALRNYEKHKGNLTANAPGYMFMAISKKVRSRIQPLGL